MVWGRSDIQQKVLGAAQGRCWNTHRSAKNLEELTRGFYYNAPHDFYSRSAFMPAANGDDQQRFALGLVFTLVAAVVASVVGFAAQRSGLAVATTVPASATAAAVDATPAPLE